MQYTDLPYAFGNLQPCFACPEPHPPAFLQPVKSTSRTSCLQAYQLLQKCPQKRPAKIQRVASSEGDDTWSPGLFLEVDCFVLIQIRKGDIQGARFWVVMQDSTAIGELEAGYKHLRLDILSKKKDNKKRGFISFLANIFINNRNNLERNRHKIGNILYARLPEESFVRFLVRSLAMGILNTLK